MPEQTRIGYLGTGLMGAPMVRRLLHAGFPVSVWNRSEDKSSSLLGDGAQLASSPSELAKEADVVCMCVTDADAVESVVFGDAGVVNGAKRGSVLVDFSSIAPDATRAMAARLKDESGMHWVDAPVSGGVRGATDGTLIVFCGGDSRVIERLTALLAAIASRTTHMGGVGAGQATKLCNQVIVSSNLLAISEALLLGQQCGIRIDRLPDALQGGWADSLPLQIIGPHLAGATSRNSIGALATMLKDIDTALALSGESRAAMRVSSEVAATYKKASDAVGGSSDLTSLRTFYGIGKNKVDSDE